MITHSITFAAPSIVFKPGAQASAHGFLKLSLCGHLYVCAFVCPPPRLLMISRVMWHDMDSI